MLHKFLYSHSLEANLAQTFSFLQNADPMFHWIKEMIVFTPQLAGKACQLGCPKIVLDHVHVYLYIYMFVRTTMLKYTLYWRYMNLGTH